MKLFTLFIIFNLSSLTFVQAEGIVKTPETLEAEASIWKIITSLLVEQVFFISPKLFVTNFHVLEGLLKNEGTLEEIRLSQEGNPNTLSIKQVLAVSALYDLALIETKETSQHYLTLSKTEAEADEDLFIASYLHGIFTRIKNTGKINYENDSFFLFSY